MKKKIIFLGAVLCMLVLTQPVSSEVVNKETVTLLWMRGFVTDLVVENTTINAYALRLKFIRFENTNGTEGETAFGAIWLKQFVVSDVYIKIPLGRLTYIIGVGETDFNVIE